MRTTIALGAVISALLGVAGVAGAQTPEASAGATTETRHLLTLTAGGALLRASDDNESSADRGRFLLDAAVRPIPVVEVALRWTDSMGSWDYVSAEPALGGGLARAHGFEHLHEINLGARLDVARLIADRSVPYHVWPYLGFAYLGLQSQVYDSQAFGGGLGLGLAYDLDPRTTVDATFATFRSFVDGGGADSAFGPVVGIWEWSGGVSLGTTEFSRIRIAYVGEALDRSHTTRQSHGALFTFQVSLL